MFGRLKTVMGLILAVVIGFPTLCILAIIYFALFPVCILDIPIWIIWDKTPVYDFHRKLGEFLP